MPVVVVIPTVRAVQAEYVRAIPADVPILVVNDGTGEVPLVHPGMRVFSLDDQRRIMGRDYDLIPRGTAACRNFGFYYALCHTDATQIVTFDDDVSLPAGCLDAYGTLGQTVEVETITGTPWVNTIDLLDGVTAGQWFTRGFPFERRGASPSATRTQTRARIVSRMGLWNTVLDTHALDKVLFDDYRVKDQPRGACVDTVRIGTGAEPVKFPMCSMNFGATRDLLPALYQIPMQSVFADRYPLWRYDDIWAGYLAQTLCAIRDDAMVVGAPVVQHMKAGDLHRELAGEHFGLLMSASLYALVDEASAHVRSADYAEMYAALADAVLTHGPRWRTSLRVPDRYWDYYASLFSKLSRWAALCGSLPPV